MARARAARKNVPTNKLARLDAKKDPCEQSWKTMYVRSRQAALTGAKASARRGDTPSAKYIATLMPMYATTEAIMSARLRSGRGVVYTANNLRHDAGSPPTLPTRSRVALEFGCAVRGSA